MAFNVYVASPQIWSSVMMAFDGIKLENACASTHSEVQPAADFILQKTFTEAPCGK